LPKLVVVAAILALTGHWMITQLVDYVQQLYGTIPQLLT
jgi:flagellar biosynthesis protein FliQ